MKKVVVKLVKKLAPKRTDDLLEVDPVGLEVGGKISITDLKQPWLALAREAYRLVKSSR